MLNVASLGAGVQSTTMVLMAAHGEITPMPDAAIFADTGAEPAEVYEHLAWLKSPNVLPFPVHSVMFSNIREDMEKTAAGEKQVALRSDGFIGAPFYTRNEDGSIGKLNRECTQNYKIRPIQRKLKELLGRDPDKRVGVRKAPLACQWIGISSDEDHRVNTKAPAWLTKRYPLIDIEADSDGIRIVGERRMSRGDCIEWMERNGYPRPPRSACTFCPFRKNTEWAHMRDNQPEAWADAVRMDALIRDLPAAKIAGLNEGGQLYVHRDAVPLEEVRIDNPDQGSIWDDECEGMCGN